MAASLSITQIAFLRGLGGLLLVVVLARGRVWRYLPTGQVPLQILRGLMTVGYAWVFAYSYSQLPLTDATALSYASSIYIVLLAPFLLGEPIVLRRWIAVGSGFVGTILIVKPGFHSLSLPYLFILVGTSLNALAFLLTKRLERRDGPLTIMLWFSALTAVSFSPALATVSDQQLSLSMLGLLAFGAIGQYLGILALRYEDAATLAPYNYVRLILATLIALSLLGERPDVWSIIGASVIFGSCVLAMRPVRRSKSGDSVGLERAR